MIIIYPLPKNLRVAPTHTLPSLFVVWEPVNSQMWTFEVTDPYPSCATLWTPEMERTWRNWPLLHCWWECKLVQPLWKTVWRFLKKLKIELSYDPAIPLLGMYPEKTLIWKATCPRVHCSTTYYGQDMEATSMSIGRGMDKEDVVHICMEYYSAIKKNEIMPFAATRMDLEIIILSEVSQTNTKWYHSYVESNFFKWYK